MWLKHILICTLVAAPHAVADDLKDRLLPSGIVGSVPIDNGVTGDGRWQVLVGQGGDVLTANLDPIGNDAQLDVIRNIYTYIDVGANGGAFPLNDPPAAPTPPMPGPNDSVVSSGQFSGSNAAIVWNSSGVIVPGTNRYQVTLLFNSTQAFGTLRVIHYLDADLFDSGDDKLVVIGAPNSMPPSFVTLDSARAVAVAHAVGQHSVVNANYVGWAASDYSVLRDNILGSGVPFSAAGTNLTPAALPPTTDARFPFSPVYGPADPTTAIAFDLSAGATSAQIVFIVEGRPNVQNDGLFRDGFQ